MVETRKKLGLDACVLYACVFLLCISSISYGDPCKDACDPSCTALKCHVLSGALGGCWFDGTRCFNCNGGDKDLATCEQYGTDSCNLNPCALNATCTWMTSGVCVTSGAQLLGCKEKGCKFSYRCMADGECVHYTIPVQQYCNTAYRQYGMYYDLKDLSACQNIASACNEIDKKCAAVNNDTADEAQRKRECLTLGRMCLQCQGDCELQKSTSGIENVIYGVAAGLAIVVLIINSLRLASSDDSVTRNNAKKSIIYVVIGLAVIVVAVKAVEYVWISFI